jgi:hypothetical protein
LLVKDEIVNESEPKTLKELYSQLGNLLVMFSLQFYVDFADYTEYGILNDTVCNMAKLAAQEWNFASFDNFSNWSDKLGDAHMSSALAKHQLTLICLSHSIDKLSNPLSTVPSPTLPEPDPTPSVTRAKEKKLAPPSPTVNDPSLVLLNDPLVCFFQI